MSIEELPWSPSRVLTGLSRIGYSPVEAILDIIDNSVSAGATIIEVSLETSSLMAASGRGRPRQRFEKIKILDNGCGMDMDGLRRALTLGSTAANYSANSLSKFGLGLKSASGSLGRRLEVRSRVLGGTTVYAVLDHDEIARLNRYVCEFAQTADGLPVDRGTEVVIANLHEDLPRPSDVRDELERALGLTYARFLRGTSGRAALRVSLNGKPVDPFDPLFEQGLTEGELLDPVTWDGRTVKWLQVPIPIQITPTISAQFAVTQLPHPPSVARAGDMSQPDCRDKFGISAKTYGVYVYRNDRLIGKAVDLDGLIPRDQDLYAYRARLDITSAADDALHIDVAKSHIQLSQIAKDQITECIKETVAASRRAWKAAGEQVAAAIGVGATEQLNEDLDRVARQDARAQRDEIDAAPREVREVLEQQLVRVEEAAPLGPTVQAEVRQSRRRVLYNASLPDNQLWCRQFHPELGSVAVVNSGHRFSREVLCADDAPPALRRAFEVLIFAAADAERQLMFESDSTEDAQRVVDDYRARVGDVLSNLLRRLGTDIIRGGE
jgi:hypothetical protein